MEASWKRKLGTVKRIATCKPVLFLGLISSNILMSSYTQVWAAQSVKKCVQSLRSQSEWNPILLKPIDNISHLDDALKRETQINYDIGQLLSQARNQISKSEYNQARSIFSAIASRDTSQLGHFVSRQDFEKKAMLSIMASVPEIFWLSTSTKDSIDTYKAFGSNEVKEFPSQLVFKKALDQNFDATAKTKYDEYLKTVEQSSENVKLSFEEFKTRLTRESFAQIDLVMAKMMYLVRLQMGHFKEIQEMQPPGQQVSVGDLKKQQSILRQTIKTAEDWEAALVYQVLIVLGRVKTFQDYGELHLATKGMEHEGLALRMLRARSDLIPSFDRLSPENKQLLFDSLSASTTNIGAIIQGEEVASSLAGMQKISPKARKFKILASLGSIAGVNGNKVPLGNIMTKDKSDLFLDLMAASDKFTDDRNSIYSVYNNFLDRVAARFGIVESRAEFRNTLTRLCMMTGFFKPADASRFQEAFAKLPIETQTVLANELSETGQSRIGIKLFMGPAVWRNFEARLEAEGENPKSETSVQKILQFYGDLYAKTRKRIESQELKAGVFRLNVEAVGKWLKNSESAWPSSNDFTIDIATTWAMEGDLKIRNGNKKDNTSVLATTGDAKLDKKISEAQALRQKREQLNEMNRQALASYYGGDAQILPMMDGLEKIRNLDIGQMVYDETNLPETERVESWVVDSFKDQQYLTIRLTKPLVLVRGWDGRAGKAGLKGGFYATGLLDRTGTKTQLAVLPEWGSNMKAVSIVEAKPGTLIRIGVAAPQKSKFGTEFAGGLMQVHINNSNDLYDSNRLQEVRRLEMSEVFGNTDHQHRNFDLRVPTKDIREFAKVLVDRELSDLEVIRIVDQSYPTVRWLRGKASVSPTAVKYDISPNSPSVLMGGKHQPEYDRAMVSVLLLRRMILDDYSGFTKGQPANSKLTLNSFRSMRSLVMQMLTGKDKGAITEIDLGQLDLLLVKMTIHDWGKSNLAQDIVHLLLNYKGDHDKVLVQALQSASVLSPEFDRLPSEQQQMILRSLLADYNFGQLVQGENVAANLLGLEGLDRDSYQLYLSYIFLDIAGVLGHMQPDGSKLMTEPVFRGFKAGLAHLPKLINKEKSAVEVYRDIMRDLGTDLNLPGETDQDLVRIRIAKLAASKNVNEAAILLQALDHLPAQDQAIIYQELNKTGVESDWGQLLYYGPRVFTHVAEGLKKQNAYSLESVYEISLMSLAKVLREVSANVENQTGHGVNTIMLIDVVSELANGNPKALIEKPLHLDLIKQGEHELFINVKYKD